MPHAVREDGTSKPGFDPVDYERGRYKDILDMMRGGAADEEVMAKYQGTKPSLADGVDKVLCGVYRKILSGGLCNLQKGGVGGVLNHGSKAGDRRRRMLAMAAAGMDDAEIAEQIGCTIGTVREVLNGDRRMI